MSNREGDAEKACYWQKTIREAARSGMSLRELFLQRRSLESVLLVARRSQAGPTGANAKPGGRSGSNEICPGQE